VKTQSSTNTVSVDVSVEPKEAWALKRIARRVPSLAGHVPLLGRLPALRHENGDNIVSARPDADLEPQVPASAGRTLDSEVAVDVAASIDSGGTVRNTEILRGAETEFAGSHEAVEGTRDTRRDGIVSMRFRCVGEMRTIQRPEFGDAGAPRAFIRLVPDGDVTFDKFVGVHDVAPFVQDKDGAARER